MRNLQDFDYEDLHLVQQRVDRYLQDFKKGRDEKKRELLSKRNQPDEDGWVTVTRARGRRNTNRDASGAVVTAANPHELKNLKPKKKELKDFYRFQIRESKRKGKLSSIQLKERFGGFAFKV